jgi:hypothetical protein
MLNSRAYSHCCVTVFSIWRYTCPDISIIVCCIVVNQTHVIQPALPGMANESNPVNLDPSVANQLIQFSDMIVIGSLALHMLFGGVMGFCSRLAVI